MTNEEVVELGVAVMARHAGEWASRVIAETFGKAFEDERARDGVIGVHQDDEAGADSEASYRERSIGDRPGGDEAHDSGYFLGQCSDDQAACGISDQVHTAFGGASPIENARQIFGDQEEDLGIPRCVSCGKETCSHGYSRCFYCSCRK